MRMSYHKIEYKDVKELSKELEFIIACDRVSENELICVENSSKETVSRFKNAASRLLRAMKRDGIIQLFVYGSELEDKEKMETVYLLNKFPELSEFAVQDVCRIYIKL